MKIVDMIAQFFQVKQYRQMFCFCCGLIACIYASIVIIALMQ